MAAATRKLNELSQKAATTTATHAALISADVAPAPAARARELHELGGPSDEQLPAVRNRNPTDLFEPSEKLRDFATGSRKRKGLCTEQCKKKACVEAREERDVALARLKPYEQLGGMMRDVAVGLADLSDGDNEDSRATRALSLESWCVCVAVGTPWKSPLAAFFSSFFRAARAQCDNTAQNQFSLTGNLCCTYSRHDCVERVGSVPARRFVRVHAAGEEDGEADGRAAAAYGRGAAAYTMN